MFDEKSKYEEAEMKLSKYYRKEHFGEGRYILYNTLHMKPIIAKQDEVSEVEKMEVDNPVIIEELLHAGIYVLKDSTDANALMELQSNLESHFGKIKIVYIILTDVCNLRCSYCAVKNIADKDHVIDTYNLNKCIYTKFVKEYVSYALSHNIFDPEFIFYGGEPLLNWNTLIDIVEMIDSTLNRTVKPKYSVVTNGTLLTEDKIIFCKEHRINIGLSADGPHSITDKTRKTENGMGAYSKIIHAMELLKKHDYIPSLSVTISEDVLRNQETVVEWLREMHLLFGIKDISYNLLHFQGEEFDKEKYSIAAGSFIIKSYKELGDIINDSRINRKILSFTRSTFFYGDCAAITGNQIVLKANGDIGLCQAFCQSNQTTVGNIGVEKLSDIIENAVIPALSKYKQFLPVFRKSCQGCDAIFACGGGCYWESNDCDRSCDVGYCQYSKILHEWMLGCLDKQTTE
jgi:radical SAM domain protein